MKAHLKRFFKNSIARILVLILSFIFLVIIPSAVRALSDYYFSVEFGLLVVIGTLLSYVLVAEWRDRQEQFDIIMKELKAIKEAGERSP